MRISIVGAGHVGLVTGVCLAEKGHDVMCVDVDAKKIEKIQQGISPFTETGVEELLRKHIGKRMHASTDLAAAIADTELTFLAVGTPFDGQEIDLTFVRESAKNVGEALRAKSSYHVVVVKSTVVPGTTDQVVLPILEQASGKKSGEDFGVGMNPEFLTEGEAIQDFMQPDRIVLGGIDNKTIAKMEQLYSVFKGSIVIKTNTRTAEMIKYTSNCLLATLISFSNEMANFGAAVGQIDTVEVMRGVHSSKYFGHQLEDGSRFAPPITGFLAAGCGFGGSCLPKDTQALVARGGKLGAEMSVLKAVLKVNASQPSRIFTLLKREFPSLKGVKVAVLGLAFRPGTDDMRESPAIPIVKELLVQGAEVRAYDPAALHEAQRMFAGHDVQLSSELITAIEGAQAIVVITSWDKFRELPELLKTRTPQPVVVDGRRMLEKSSVARYAGIGL